MVTMMLTDGQLIAAWKLLMSRWWLPAHLNGGLPHNLASSNYPTMLMLCPSLPGIVANFDSFGADFSC